MPGYVGVHQVKGMTREEAVQSTLIIQVKVRAFLAKLTPFSSSTKKKVRGECAESGKWKMRHVLAHSGLKR